MGMWDLQPKTGMTISIWGLPSAAGFALEYFIVQRASVSFWRALAGLSGQMSVAFRQP